MDKALIPNILRFLGLLALQILVLKRITLGWGGFYYMNILVYPLFIILLPFRTPRAGVLILAFLMGIIIDFFYDSPGLHASASVAIAFFRPMFLRWQEPRGGYNTSQSPTKKYMEWPWFLRYASYMMILHLFFYFSVEYFTFVYFFEILLKTIVSFIASMAFILMIMIIFNPKD